MKTISTLILFGFFISTCLSQPDPINITFVEAQPKWEHLTLDTNFYPVGIQPDINKYTVVTPHKFFRFQDDLVLLHYCTNYNASIYGYILEKLNAHTGETEWQNYSTYYNGGFQDFYKTVTLRPDGFLEMQGIKRLGPYVDSIPFYWNTGGGNSNFIRKIFNYQTGALNEIIESQDSIEGIIPHYLNFYTTILDSVYLMSKMYLQPINNSYEYSYAFFPLDSSGNYLSQGPINTVKYETTDAATAFSYNQPQFIRQIDDTSWVCLIFKDRVYPEKTKAQLIWFTMSPDFEIKVTRRMQIEDFIPGDGESFLYLSFEVINGITYISQPYFNDGIQGITSYLIGFDRDGNLVRNFQNCANDGYVYQYITRIYSSTFFDYFAALPSRTGRQGFDILKLNRSDDQFQYISSLTSAFPDEQFTRQMEACRMYDDGLFVIGAYTKKLGDVQNSAVKYYGFDGKDLGMSIPTATEPSPPLNTFAVFPNPSKDELSISFDGNIQEIRLFSMDGRRLTTNLLYSNKKLNIKTLPTGIYYLIIQSDNQFYSITFSKL